MIQPCYVEIFPDGSFSAGEKIASSFDSDDRIELMQFTGIKDKNGKEIFEGDILKCNWLAELGICELDCEANAIVNYQNDTASFKAEFLRKYFKRIDADGVYEEHELPLMKYDEDLSISFELIGNIHENPELLPNP